MRSCASPRSSKHKAKRCVHAGFSVYAAIHPTASGLARDQLRTRLADLPGSTDGEDPVWPGLELDELLHRVVVESSIGYAPLIATMRGATLP